MKYKRLSKQIERRNIGAGIGDYTMKNKTNKELFELQEKCNEVFFNEQEMKELIANNLQRLRREKDYTQEEVAEILGISRTSVGRHEQYSSKDIPCVYHLVKYAKLYESSLDYIILGINN